MRNFVKMLSDLEYMRQDVKLSMLANNKTKIGIFCPVIGEKQFDKCVRLCLLLRNQGIDVVGVCMFEEALDFFSQINRNEYLINIAKMDELKKIDEVLIFNMHSMWGELIYIYFKRKNIPTYMIEFDDCFYDRRDWYYKHMLDLYDCYADFNDEQSRKTFLGVIREGASGQLSEYVMAEEPQYMLCGYAPRKGDVVIDGGAFDGETAKDFMRCGAKVYSFEMDEKNYLKCKEYGDTLGFHVENKGLWSEYKILHYNPKGAASSIVDEGEKEAEMIDIDTWSSINNIGRIDFIKMDIEGAELEALKGAKKTICSCKPRLAICTYHQPEDMFRIQQYIKSIRPDYEFAFRHYPLTDKILYPYQKEIYKHYDLGKTISTWCECVLYAR